MRLTNHVNIACQKAYNQLPNNGKIRKYLSQDTKKEILHAFVITRLDYLNRFLYGMSAYIITRLQILLNAAARIVTNLGKYDHITDAMKNLHWLQVESLVHAYVNMVAPPYLSYLLTSYVPMREMLSTGRMVLSMWWSKIMEYII